jgi:hypothetical protein
MPDSESQMDKLDSKLAGLEKKLDDATEERKRLQIGMALATTFMTAVVGFGGWFAQSRVQQHIDEKSKELETRLALEQQVYVRELDRYESVHQQMAVLVAALGEVQLDPTRKKSAVDAINNLYVAYTTNSLYLSDTVVNQLKTLVDLGGRLPSLDSSGNATMPEVDEQISSIENQMKGDLKLSQLGQIPALGTHP